MSNRSIVQARTIEEAELENHRTHQVIDTILWVPLVGVAMDSKEIFLLKELLQWTQSKWQGIDRKLESFYIENRTNPYLINVKLKFGYPHSSRNPFYEYARVGALDEQAPISREDFDRLVNAAKEIATNYKALVDRCYPIASHVKEQELVDDVTSMDTKVIKIQNLPLDVRPTELVDLITNLFPQINLFPSDVIVETDSKSAGSKQAYISFKHKTDSLNVYNKLKDQVFGQKIMQVNFSIGRPNSCLWIGNINKSNNLTEENIWDAFEVYGPVKRVDVRTSHSNSYAFVEFNDIKSALTAFGALKSNENNQVIKLLGHGISIRFGSSKADKPVANDLRNVIRTRSRSRSRERTEPNRNRDDFVEQSNLNRIRRDNTGHGSWGPPNNQRPGPDSRGYNNGGDAPRDNRGHGSFGPPNNQRPGPDSRGYNDGGDAPRDDRGHGSWGPPNNQRPGPDNRG